MRKIISKRPTLRCLALAASLWMALLLAVAAAGCGGSEEHDADGRLKVAVSIAPLADFVKQVGGERVEVELMVPSGASPHTYEPTAAQMKFLSEAQLLVVNGLKLEAWATDILGKVGSRDLVMVEAASYVPEEGLIAAGAGGHEHEHESEAHEHEVGAHDHEHAGEAHDHDHAHGIYDPHVWLDPELAAFQVQAIRDALMGADPEHAQEYRDNAAAYMAQLEELDAWVRGQVASFTSKAFVAFHSSWTYFARRYGLEMVGVVEELPGKEPGAAHIAKLVDAIRTQGATVVFAEPQFSTRAAEAVADASGGEVEVAILDPLGSPDDSARNSYDKLMRHNVEVMGQTLD